MRITQRTQRHNFLRNEYILNPAEALCSARQVESSHIQHVLKIPVSVFCNLTADVSSRRCKAASIVPIKFQQEPFDTYSVDYEALKRGGGLYER